MVGFGKVLECRADASAFGPSLGNEELSYLSGKVQC